MSIELTKRDKLMVIRGISVAAGLLKNVGKDAEYTGLMDYMQAVADSWGLEPDESEESEFLELVRELNRATEETRQGPQGDVK